MVFQQWFHVWELLLSLSLSLSNLTVFFNFADAAAAAGC
jgi:hypothetical protein